LYVGLEGVGWIRDGTRGRLTNLMSLDLSETYIPAGSGAAFDGLDVTAAVGSPQDSSVSV